MNTADFTTQPNGFPLESDATLGFMQTDYQTAIKALAIAIGGVNTIITGLEVVNNIAADGWILLDGDLVFFEGGAVSANFYIDEEVTAKANQSGTVVDRYMVKRARFGSSANQVAFSSLGRVSDLTENAVVLNMISNFGAGFQNDFVVLSGLKPLSGGIGSGKILHGNTIITVQGYSASTVSEANPIYLTKEGEWTNAVNALHLKFEPYHNRGLDTINQKAASKLGEIRLVTTAQLDTNYFVSGLGRWDWDGWRIADGTNGTVDLSAAIAGLTGLQRV